MSVTGVQSIDNGGNIGQKGAEVVVPTAPEQLPKLLTAGKWNFHAHALAPVPIANRKRKLKFPNMSELIDMIGSATQQRIDGLYRILSQHRPPRALEVLKQMSLWQEFDASIESRRRRVPWTLAMDDLCVAANENRMVYSLLGPARQKRILNDAAMLSFWLLAASHSAGTRVHGSTIYRRTSFFETSAPAQHLVFGLVILLANSGGGHVVPILLLMQVAVAAKYINLIHDGNHYQIAMRIVKRVRAT